MFFSLYNQRQVSCTRFLVLLIIVLNTLETKYHTIKMIHKKHFEIDLKYCHKCFESQIQNCSIIFEQIQQPVRYFSIRQLLTFLPEIFQIRNNHFIKLKSLNETLIAKYLFKRRTLSKYILVIDQLKREFLQQQKDLQGIQYAPLETLDIFIKTLQKFHANFLEYTIYNYLLNDLQPLIYPILYEHNFPVPKTYAVCGFTLYQQYAGEDLYSFFKSDFITKLEISRQLLQAAIKFSLGFDNYRLYITDLTADNIVYDKANKQIYFIDLDTIFIVDSTATKHKTSIHKHVHIECSGCFAYIADEIASYNISDVNIYSTCQFLREDLYREHSRGFLYPIPPNFNLSDSKLWQLLNKCVDCPDSVCMERFTVAEEFIELIEEILQY